MTIQEEQSLMTVFRDTVLPVSAMPMHYQGQE